MAMTYDEFKTYVTQFLWKTGSVDFDNDFDNIVRMANAELNTRLRAVDRQAERVFLADKLVMPLPSDYRSMRVMSFTELANPTMKYVQPADMVQIIVQANAATWRPFYSIVNKNLLLCGNVDDPRIVRSDTAPTSPNEGDLWLKTTAPFNYSIYQAGTWHIIRTYDVLPTVPTHDPQLITMYYNVGVPDYKAADESWLEEQYLDLYVYAIAKHAAFYFREDERVQVVAAHYEPALNAVNEHTAFEAARGVSASKPLPRQAGVNRRGNRYTYPRNLT